MIIMEERKIPGEQLQTFICVTPYVQAWKSKVTRDGKEREEIVSGVHTGFGGGVESNAHGSHCGFDQTEEKIASRML
ncbi:hypothetical protein PoB_001557200 [Plakobranchus ocellatus]|uniref:Uncharacterized protein n=1 Tax=Plakobranchus ocellatus TaxID=259542 RepID=A0AAV3Z3D9_9GAST|nr:hypothetical protein PoB_001557200 [Plakobranchus ocellatus]